MAVLKENDIDLGHVTVLSNGIKTYAQLLNELFALIDVSLITPRSYIMLGSNFFPVSSTNSVRTIITFATVDIYDGMPSISTIYFSSDSMYRQLYSGSVHDYSNEIPGANMPVQFYY